tara:strand:+ start:10515 stop:10766 length:252 start_codon:yes stop_codon:yes gene_type:complete
MEMKLSIKAFNRLTIHEQYDLVFTQGEFVNYFIKDKTRFALYSIFNFFVEIEYQVASNTITNLISFEDGVLLDRYWIITDLTK